MTKNIFIITLLTLFLFGANAQAETTMTTDAIEYGYCHELSNRALKGDEIIFYENCDTIIQKHELNLEKKSLVNRIKVIDKKLSELNNN